MRLDPTALRYLSRDEFRVLTACEMGMKNHDLVPRELVCEIADLRHGGADKLISTLLRHKCLHHESKHFDGYRLTTLGYDFLALRAFNAKGLVSGVGKKLGVGKESDIFLVENTEERRMVLKLHRLGRTSFRKIKDKRDYHGRRGHPSWIYLSRLAAQKEYAHMVALHKAGFPVPEPIDANRHCILMSLLQGYPLHMVTVMEKPENCAREMMKLIARLGRSGLIHGDFNEFNVSVSKEDSSDLVMYDFPQMVSMNHPNARMYFERDVNCVSRFFRKRFNVVLEREEIPDFETICAERNEDNLDVLVGASGFSVEEGDDLENALNDLHLEGEDDRSGSEDDEDDDEEEEDEEEDEDDDEEGESDEEDEEEEEETNDGPQAYLTHDYVVDRKPLSHSAASSKARAAAVSSKAQAGGTKTRLNRVHKEVASQAKREAKGTKTSKNTVKSREKRRVLDSMKDW